MNGDQSLRVNYLLEDTALFGGVKVVLHHAELLRRKGHRVRVVSPAEAPNWYPAEHDFVKVPRLDPVLLPEADLHVATFWTTVAPAMSAATGCPVHFCQGFEGALEHNREDHPRIAEAYAHRIPVWTVSPHLAELNSERFGRSSMLVTPALENFWQPRPRSDCRRCPRVLVAHPFEFYMKGVNTALTAVQRLRRDGLEIELVRLSQWPLSDAERELIEPDEFHHHLRPKEVAELVAGCDLLLAPSWESEGFGLSVLEAMACGVPVVASDISSHRCFAGSAASLVPANDAAAFADAARAVLADDIRWNEMRQRGLEAARRFSEEEVSEVLERAVAWAISDEWRTRA